MPNSRRQFAKAAQLRFIEDRRDQQNGIGARGRRFEDVVFGDGEILAEDRQRAGGARRAEDRRDCPERNRGRSERRAPPPRRARIAWPDPAGWKSSTRTPLLGDAFLISEMMAGRLERNAAAKSRRSFRFSFAIVRSSDAGIAAARSSSRLRDTIRARMSGSGGGQISSYSLTCENLNLT